MDTQTRAEPTTSNHPVPYRVTSPPLASRFATRVRSLLSLLAITGLLVGVPLALIILVGWPLPTAVPTFDALRDAFERDGVPVEVLINGLAIVVWLAWIQLVWALGAEAVALAEGRVARRARFLPGTQLLARHLVASAALVLSSLGAVRPVAAAPLTALQEVGPANDPVLRSAEPDPFGVVLPTTSTTQARAVTTTTRPPSTTSTTPPTSLPSSTSSSSTSAPSAPVGPSRPSASAPSPNGGGTERVYEVQRGDTFWGLAERHLGTGVRWKEIRDRNVGRAVAPGRVLALGDDHLEVGWQLILPASATGTSSLPPEPMTAPPWAAPPGTPLAAMAETSDWAEPAPATPAPATPAPATPVPATPAPATPAPAPSARDAGARDTETAAPATDAAAPFSPGAGFVPETEATASAPAAEAAPPTDARPDLGISGRVPDDPADASTSAPASLDPVAEAAPAPAATPAPAPAPVAAPAPLPRRETRSTPRVAEPAASGSAAAGTPAGSPTVGQATAVVVEPGDHFWGLAERQLEEAWGRPVTAAEIAPYWRNLIDANRSRLGSGDPNVIFPGERYSAPATPAAPPAAPGTPAP
ncbi:MAG TPA: LysM peptidoglycan-binding domain-containing protein, partial [Acidimicrobiales bacterium]|nr:LysM peptidoglycan-binding domain-containing protein [Acidimicrobiales bacterium]